MRVKPRKREAGKNQGLQASELEYKQGETQFANYARLGLLADANQIGAVRGGGGGDAGLIGTGGCDPGGAVFQGGFW